MRGFTKLLVLLALCAAAGPLAADKQSDKLDELMRSAIYDSSWRVRLQAVVILGKLRDPRSIPTLRVALRDANETVRAVSVQVLVDLNATDAIPSLARLANDPSAVVRDKAAAGLARLRAGPEATPVNPSDTHVEIASAGNRSKNTPAELAGHLRTFVARELQHTPGLTLDGKPASGYVIDSAITTVNRRTTDTQVEVSCEVSLVVGRLPSKAMVMMTSGGATASAPRSTWKPQHERALQVDALEGAVKGAHENLVAFLKTQRTSATPTAQGSRSFAR